MISLQIKCDPWKDKASKFITIQVGYIAKPTLQIFYHCKLHLNRLCTLIKDSYLFVVNLNLFKQFEIESTDTCEIVVYC